MRPELLGAVREEAQQLKSRQRDLDDPLKRSKRLMEFVEEAFNQSFKQELGIGISGFSQADKEEILRVAEGPASTGLPIDDLVRLYVDICNVWPDILSQSYGGSAADFREFRAELIPSLLGTLKDVAQENGDAALREAIEDSKTAYQQSIRASGSDE